MFWSLEYVRAECFCYLNLLKQTLQIAIFFKTFKQIAYNIPYFFHFHLPAYQ